VDTTTVELHDDVRAPDVGSRVDDAGLLYSATVNMLYGAPESGKSLIATALAVQTINSGGSVLWVDIDHNGATATLSRFVSFGADLADLNNPSKFLRTRTACSG
jgi:KaiC/GvpD/RAD55 family RecA-like ATPase